MTKIRKTAEITIRVEPEFRRQLNEKSDRVDVPLSRVIRTLLKAWLKK